MASTKYAGNAGAAEVPTGSAIAGIKSWTIDLVYEVGETTSFDDVGVGAFLPTVSHWSGTFEGYKTGVPLTIGAVTTITLEETATATQQFVGACIITGLHASAGHDGIVTYSYDFQGTAALTIPTA